MLAKRGHTVGLLDADVWGFSIPRMLGVRENPTVVDERLIIPPEAHGFKMISIGNFVPEDNPVVWRGPMLHKALQQFLSDVHWRSRSTCSSTCPPVPADISISLAQFAPGTRMILVTTPQMAGGAGVAERAGHMANKVGMKVGRRDREHGLRPSATTAAERTYPFGSGGGRSLPTVSAPRCSVRSPSTRRCATSPTTASRRSSPCPIRAPPRHSAPSSTSSTSTSAEAQAQASQRKSLPLIVTPAAGGHRH